VSIAKLKTLGPWIVNPGSTVLLARHNPDGSPEAPNDGDRAKTEAATRRLKEKLSLQHSLIQANDNRAVLIVLQAMDAGGKDGTVKCLYGGLNPAGTEVVSFGVPSEVERKHDVLWRIHNRLPEHGRVGIFNRSHYEDVLAVRVRNIAPPAVWRPRFEQFNEFEKVVADSGTTIIKCMLHISAEEQRERLQARVDRTEKHWKFRMGDLEDRALWADYQRAYQDVLSKTSTDHAPWFVIPSNKKWYRDFAVLTIITTVLDSLKMKFPENEELRGLIVK
jgi:PPK2 family polyphosphate:nucleotide phosphotransferase